MKVTLGQNGKPKHAPFYVELSSDDFGGDLHQYEAYISELEAAYMDERKNAQPGEPLRSEFAPSSAGERAYSAAVQRWAISEGLDEALEKADNRRKPTPTPDAMPLPLQVAHRGNQRDKEHFNELSGFARIVQEQAEKALEAEALGNTKLAAERANRAAWFNMGVKKAEKGYTYSFVEADRKESLDFGKRELEKILTWTPKQIEENMPYVTSLLEGYRAMSDEEESFLLDTGSPYASQEDNPLRVVRVVHPGMVAKELTGRSGKQTNQELLDHAHKVGWSIKGHEMPAKEEPAPEKKDEAEPATEELSMKEYNKYVEGENAKAAAKAKDSGPTVAPGMFGG